VRTLSSSGTVRTLTPGKDAPAHVLEHASPG
jgi:hypothetical protein